MVVALLRVELHIPHAQSLKDKRMVTRRQVLQSVLDEIDRLDPGVMTRSEVEFLR